MPVKTTLYLEPESYRRLKALAARSGRTAAELVREAVIEYARRHARLAAPRSLGAGRSGRPDLGSRSEALLKGFGEGP